MMNEFIKQGVIHSMTLKRIRQLFEVFNPKTEDEKVALCASAENTYIWEQKFAELDIIRFQQMVSTTEFMRYPCYVREDFECFLIELGKNVSEAHQISECIRKGYLVKQPERMDAFDIPEEILKIAKNYCYVTSRTMAKELWMKYKENIE